MFLHKTKRSNGRIYLALMEAYRQGGKTKQRTIRSLGYLDELEKQYDGSIAYFKAHCEKQNALAKA